MLHFLSLTLAAFALEPPVLVATRDIKELDVLSGTNTALARLEQRSEKLAHYVCDPLEIEGTLALHDIPKGDPVMRYEYARLGTERRRIGPGKKDRPASRFKPCVSP